MNAGRLLLCFAGHIREKERGVAEVCITLAKALNLDHSHPSQLNGRKCKILEYLKKAYTLTKIRPMRRQPIALKAKRMYEPPKT